MLESKAKGMGEGWEREESDKGSLEKVGPGGSFERLADGGK